MKKKTSLIIIGGLLIIILIESLMLISREKKDNPLHQNTSTLVETSYSEEGPEESSIEESKEISPSGKEPYILPPKAMVGSISLEELQFDMEEKKLITSIQVHPLPGMEGILLDTMVSSICKAEFRAQLSFYHGDQPDDLLPNPVETEVDFKANQIVNLTFSFEDVHFPADLYTMKDTNQNLNSVSIIAKFPAESIGEDVEFIHSVINPNLSDPNQNVWVHEGKVGNEIQD